MDIASKLNARSVRMAAVLALAGFVSFLTVPSVLRVAAVVVMVAGSLAVVFCALAWRRTAPGSTGISVVSIVSALGLVGSVAYLSSIADEPAAIPLGGTFALLLSLVGLVVSFFCVNDKKSREPVSR
jgi:formate hydrogenlyase subunit 3/multisubunit Na+/H+ antiporter MnhD subunit